VAQDVVVKRQWADCHEGKDPKPTIRACTALIGYHNSTGAELALIKLKLGRAQREDDEVDEAIRTYSESIRLAPTAEAYNDRGIAHFDKGQWDDAISDYTEAIRLDKNHGEAYNNRAWTQLKAGRASLALEDANAAVRLLPNRAYVWDTRGQVNEKLGNRAAAIRDLRKALELDPKSEGSKQALRRFGETP
jgi:tetratricopeptide (TPR) repeat protein